MALANNLLEGVTILQWDEDIEDLDPWVSLDELEQVFKSRGIRPDRGKEAHLMVVNEEGKVVGGSFNSISNTGSGVEYSFDIAILPEYEGKGIGTDLISQEIRNARNLECDLIYVWAVNPWMARTLEDKFNFDPSQKMSDGSATLHLTL